jgi:hypothetical protein
MSFYSEKPKKLKNKNLKEIQEGMFLMNKIVNSIDLEFFIEVIEKGLSPEHLSDEQLFKVLKGGARKWVRIAEVAIKFRDDTREVLT